MQTKHGTVRLRTGSTYWGGILNQVPTAGTQETEVFVHPGEESKEFIQPAAIGVTNPFAEGRGVEIESWLYWAGNSSGITMGTNNSAAFPIGFERVPFGLYSALGGSVFGTSIMHKLESHNAGVGFSFDELAIVNAHNAPTELVLQTLHRDDASLLTNAAGAIWREAFSFDGSVERVFRPRFRVAPSDGILAWRLKVSECGDSGASGEEVDGEDYAFHFNWTLE